jgi:hypothetical protein
MAKRQELDIDEMVERLLHHWNKIDHTDTEQGQDWYSEAQRFCVGVSELIGIEYTRIAAVVAVTSPNTYWTQQQIYVPLIIKAWQAGKPANKVGFTMLKLVEKAYACLNGDLSAIHGNKVSSFFLNICGDSSAVTVDRWAARIALADYNITRFTPRWYAPIAEAYRRAARLVGWTPRDFQATLWVYARQTQGGLQQTLQMED